jgi:hypothetical protein
MSTIREFSLSSYKAIVQTFLADDYLIRQYDDVQRDARHLILRHDVDFDLDLAVRMAEVEAQCGWRSNYFVLLRTEFYNPFSLAGTNAIRKLGELGHKVGLHFDASIYPADKMGIVDAIGDECRILSGISSSPITSFSFHRPNPDLLDHGFQVDGLINAYDKRFFSDIAYCSDSRGGWHHGHPLDHSCRQIGHALQFLTHPVWWVQTGSSPQDKCVALLNQRQDILDHEMVENCKSYTSRRSTLLTAASP